MALTNQNLSAPGLEMGSLPLEFLDVLSKEDLARREMSTGLAPNHIHQPELDWMLEDPWDAPDEE